MNQQPLEGNPAVGTAAYARSCAASYRFTFQGQEHDDELNGATGTSYAFEYRMHDARVGRFLSIDPLAAKYLWNSPYAFAENKVIQFVELEGLETGPSLATAPPATVPAIPLTTASTLLKRVPYIGPLLTMIDLMPELTPEQLERLRGIQTGTYRQSVQKDGLFGVFEVTGDFGDVGKVGAVPDLSGMSLGDAEAALNEAGFEGGPQYDKDGNEKKNRDREYRNKDDDSWVRIKRDGDVVRSTKGSGTRGAANEGEKLIKKDGEWLRTRDQDIIHETRPSRGGQGEGITVE